MLAKCANPACSTPFRRLSDGKLFQVETEYSANEDGQNGHGRKKLHRVEHYWLCTECASFVTLAFDPENGIMTVPLPKGDFSRVRLIDPSVTGRVAEGPKELLAGSAQIVKHRL